jgi:hypothetical protein
MQVAELDLLVNRRSPHAETVAKLSYTPGPMLVAGSRIRFRNTKSRIRTFWFFSKIDKCASDTWGGIGVLGSITRLEYSKAISPVDDRGELDA